MFDQMQERNGEDTNVLVTDSTETKPKQFETCSIEATESDGFGEQKQQLVTSSIESKVFDKLSMITDVDLDDFDDSISGLLEVPQNEGCDILNRGLLDPSLIQGIWLDSLMMMRGMSFAGTNVVTGEWVNNYNPCRFLVPSFDPRGSNTTVSFDHDVINTESNVQNLHSYTMLELAEIITKLSRLSISRTRNIDRNAYMRSQIQVDLYNQLDFPFNMPHGLLIKACNSSSSTNSMQGSSHFLQTMWTRDIASLNRAEIQGCDLSQFIDLRYSQYLQKTYQYVIHATTSSTCMLVGNHVDTLQGKVWAPTHII
ncbi:hypothetical protein V6N12_068949 [Hibiscus sabdariffa]|uniref:Nucleic acid binding NABP domain-containing protein n=1 Tax=Hibiscus sabdariffa TaxID=183260 RepID=A0ABR2CAM4_9ROSI